MNAGSMLPKAPADWLAFAAAALFATLGVSFITNPETAVLRLAVLGWPTWIAPAIGITGLIGPALLLARPTRTAGALLLAFISGAQLVGQLLYRDHDSAIQPALQLVLVAGILMLEHSTLFRNRS